MNIETDIEIIEVPQGEPEWFQARAGVISASMFSTVRNKVNGLNAKQAAYVEAKLNGATESDALQAGEYASAPRAQVVIAALAGEKVGDYSDAAKNYAFRLAIERINEGPILDEQFETYAMRRGRELEEDCRLRHEADIEMLADLAGFVRTKDKKFGCSADSLVNSDGGGEYKCFVSPERLRAIIVDDDWGEIMDQTQGCLWLTGRHWWDMCLYCPPLKNAGKDFIRKRVQRDDNYIEALEADLVEFDALVEQYRALIMGDMEASEPDQSQLAEEVTW